MDQILAPHDPDGHASWEKSVTLNPGSNAYVSAQTDYTMLDGKPITTVVEILYNGEVLKRSESHGVAVVTASAKVD